MAKIVKQVWLMQSESSAEYFASDLEPSPGNALITVVAGPVSVEFDVPDVARCPHCNKALPEAEKPKLPLLPLVVGGVYRTRGGLQAEISSTCDDNFYVYEGNVEEHGCYRYMDWTDNGCAYGDGRPSIDDLIERIA